MKNTELRIGNLLHYRDKSSIVEVSNIGSYGFETINKYGFLYGSDDVNDYNPIPLTEEWLLKFGFENIDFGFFRKYTSEKYYILTHPKQGYSEICINSICGGQSSTKYVHQLQNLYFALTGEELKTT